MLLSCRATSPAPESQIMAEMQQVLDRRGAMKHAPVTVAVSDAVALGIAAIFSSPTPAGQVMEAFYRRGAIDSTELLEAVRFEQGYASAEELERLRGLAEDMADILDAEAARREMRETGAAPVPWHQVKAELGAV